MEPEATVLGMSLVNPPPSITPLSAVVILKALDEDGDLAYFTLATEGLLTVEAAGMMAYADSKIRGRWIRGEEG